MDRLTSLEVFGCVVEAGGFSAAARKLNMSTTMVANHIKGLEDSLGVLLLQRTTRKVSLTESGRFYYERSSVILSDLAETNEAVGALSSTPRGQLRVFTNASMVQSLAPIIDEFVYTHALINVSLDIGERMVDLFDGGYDLAIRMTTPASNLIARKLATWRHIPVCSPDYILANGAPEKPEDLRDHNCLQYSLYAFGNTWRFLDRDNNPVEAKVAGNVNSNSADLLRDLATRGRGVFLAPSTVVADDISAGKLVAIMPDFRGVEFAISAVFPSRNHLPTKVRLFIDLLVERYPALASGVRPA